MAKIAAIGSIESWVYLLRDFFVMSPEELEEGFPEIFSLNKEDEEDEWSFHETATYKTSMLEDLYDTVLQLPDIQTNELPETEQSFVASRLLQGKYKDHQLHLDFEKNWYTWEKEYLKNVRESNKTDHQGILDLHTSAFGEDESPSIISLVSALLKDEPQEDLLSLVYSDNHHILGHVIFSKVHMEESESVGYILAPLGVGSIFQKRGIGSTLVKEGLSTLRAKGVHFVLVYGDPSYYSRFAFSLELGKSFIPP